MRLRNRVSFAQISQFFAVSLLLVWATSARAQTVVATIPVGTDMPRAVAVNPATNKIYAASCTPRHFQPPTGSLTVIDGATNATTVVKGCFGDLAVNSVTNKIYEPFGVIDGATNAVTNFLGGIGGNVVAVNPVTNKIYVAAAGGIINVIDGATNSVTTVTDANASGLYAVAIAVNPVTNKIYVANNDGGGPNPGSVTVIDGATNATTTVIDPNAISPNSVAVNSATNKVYVANGGNYPSLNHGNITVIDGATNAATTLTDPNAVGPVAVAVNQTTNKIYVTNANDSALSANGGVTVIDGATSAISNVKDPNAVYPQALAVDSVTNIIYVTNRGCQNDACTHPGSVTVINGATNAVATVINPNAAYPAGPVALNPTTNKIYVLNALSGGAGGNVTVIDGGAAATSHVLSVLLAGNESGTVTSNPAGVNCGTSCTASFALGTAVELTASPAAGSTFSGWSDACTGAGSCNLTLNSDDFVTATFGSAGDFSVQPASVNLTAQRGGQVTDIVTITPLGQPGASFTTAVQLSCAVTPLVATPPTALATCSLAPTSVTPGANSATSTLTVTVPQSAELIPEAQLSRPLYAVFLPIPLALIGFGLASGKSKQRRDGLCLLCSLFIPFVALQTGCGGGTSRNQLTPPPPIYAVTVTATSGAIQHTAQVTVTVQ